MVTIVPSFHPLLTEHAACKWTGRGAVEVNIENERFNVVFTLALEP